MSYGTLDVEYDMKVVLWMGDLTKEVDSANCK